MDDADDRGCVGPSTAGVSLPVIDTVFAPGGPFEQPLSLQEQPERLSDPVLDR
jgi:hypothetical protein